MKASHVFAFLGGTILATAVTLLFTTDTGRDIRKQVSEKLTKEELDKLLNVLNKEKKNLENLEKEVNDEIAEVKKELKKL
ncbi:MAG: hypothetical protein LBP67_09560 [Bacteroidales bacterium]|jgi:gas vesicle protein|nr:hypothetical protein [Bacteroidales bacterium]